ERHEILHMLASPVVGQVWEAWHEQQPYDRAQHVPAAGAAGRFGAGPREPGGGKAPCRWP
ncbi:MAG TPA: hypothetical protein VGI50_18215, partial [Solirubrobacteraceae bacterium]